MSPLRHDSRRADDTKAWFDTSVGQWRPAIGADGHPDHQRPGDLQIGGERVTAPRDQAHDRGADRVQLRLAAPLLEESEDLQRKIKEGEIKEGEIKKLKLTLVITDTHHATTRVSLKLPV